ncbi:methyl-accepting chemotaxis protein [Rhizobium oryziradicis]|uniref:Chemotaxis protein n=1 Tax=Rhizobium oryziradicis TaxID=1867956 RepID=A0A1Q8ZNT3_9HYPH|nr:HAMP domain-containing methyl-accepting chemotaxis protein [Rhizobium oryziradicis]OLP43549.1 chemotaxis protein [Rhizobium oryziradicis]
MFRKFRDWSLTLKLAAIIVLVNLCGLAALALYTSSVERTSMLQMASANWLKDTGQLASVAAGGIKWGKAAAVRETYVLYRDDENLHLAQFTALNANLDVVDTWLRAGQTNGLSVDEIRKLASTANLSIDHSRVSDGLMTVVVPLPADKSGKASGYLVTSWTVEALIAAATNKALLALAMEALVIAVVVGVFLFAMSKMVGRPMAVISSRILDLQRGDLNTPVLFLDKSDEIGVLARAVETFRTESINKVENDAKAAAQRLQLDAERQGFADQSTAAAAIQKHATETLAVALETLSRGDFSHHLRGLDPQFSDLERNFNAMVEAVSEAIADAKSSALSVENGATQLTVSADQLAKRTEHQAATLEQTAAALSEVTNTIRESSQFAESTVQLVDEAKAGARNSASVVRNAIGAMDRIQDSSAKIGQIIGSIDEIAFQTNLLALNAGVEAARAGEAGKGFAVVAQEVRELAQRSANAAKEIKHLVQVSSEEVAGGVTLVNETGDALLGIEEHINNINDGITRLVSSYRAQSTGIGEINSSINHMDQMTQQNAAMVEETNAACHDLLQLSRSMQDSMGQFKTASKRGAGQNFDAVPQLRHA